MVLVVFAGLPKLRVQLRRFFPVSTTIEEGMRVTSLVPFDGKITGYLPAEGEDCALWHMRMDDGDDEELEEEEVRCRGLTNALSTTPLHPLPSPH